MPARPSLSLSPSLPISLFKKRGPRLPQMQTHETQSDERTKHSIKFGLPSQNSKKKNQVLLLTPSPLPLPQALPAPPHPPKPPISQSTMRVAFVFLVLAGLVAVAAAGEFGLARGKREIVVEAPDVPRSCIRLLARLPRWSLAARCP